MSHDYSTEDNGYSKLVIASRNSRDGDVAAVIGITDTGLGIQVRPVGTIDLARSAGAPASSPVLRVEGEDLYALREALAAMPEEAFVRPADPVKVPRWAEGDIVVAVTSRGGVVHYTRKANGFWSRIIKGLANPVYNGSSLTDILIDELVDGKFDRAGTRATVVKQASGQDL